MEFFREVHAPAAVVAYLQQQLTLNSLTQLCASISTVTTRNDNEADIYCLWGAFDLKRDKIRFGVRFSLLNCPHALAWTITRPDGSEAIRIHLTTDDIEQEAEFTESIDEFMNDWKDGMNHLMG